MRKLWHEARMREAYDATVYVGWWAFWFAVIMAVVLGLVGWNLLTWDVD